MGEYAIRKSDSQRIKIGTCESMYYLRLEDKNKVQPENGSGFGWYWRLPHPEEDGILPGDYDSHVANLRLWNKPAGEKYGHDFTDPTAADRPGTIQLRHECGLLVNVPCYHGYKLPEINPPAQAFWNGKGWFLELKCLRTDGERVHPVVECRHCHEAWRYRWADVLPYIHGEMKKRLEKYAEGE